MTNIAAAIPRSSGSSTRPGRLKFFAYNPKLAFLALGSVFLAVTGAEALYADMGHFGRKAINLSWLTLVYPCLMLNYMGQGALLLGDPQAAINPFYPARARLGAAAARGPCDRGDDHRQPGGDLRAPFRSPTRRSSSASCRA